MPNILITSAEYPAGGVNIQLLHEELSAVNIFSNSSVLGFTLTDVDTEQETIGRAIVADHDATQKSQSELNAEISASAKTDVQAIPNWAGWTETQVLDWMTTNLSSELSGTPNTETALRSMARLLVALRNQAWPDLQE